MTHPTRSTGEIFPFPSKHNAGGKVLPATWFPFRHKVVRDLVWSLGSPHMVTEKYPIVSDQWAHSIVLDNLDWIEVLDEDPSHLLDWMQGRARM